MTERVYYRDTYLAELEAVVLRSGSDEVGFYFVPDRTIFHAQGGGQPADPGFVDVDGQKHRVVNLQEEGDEIKHYIDRVISGKIRLTIDLTERSLFAKLHSAGHLLAGVVKELYPELEGYRGNHFPGGQAFVMFKGNTLPEKDSFKLAVENRLAEVIGEARAIHVNNETSPRLVQIEGFRAYPCGGTHVKNTGELTNLTLRSIKAQKGELKVGYDIT